MMLDAFNVVAVFMSHYRYMLDNEIGTIANVERLMPIVVSTIDSQPASFSSCLTSRFFGSLEGKEREEC
jgi:hypothetical protein